MSRRLKAQLWYRSLTALFGVWFVLATTDVASTHTCPMHDGPQPTAASIAPESAHHHHATASHQDASHEGASHEGGHACTCIGSCSTATVPMPAAASVVAFLETLNDPAELLSEPVVLPRVSKIDFVLPFATAPPMNRHA